jgi:hypothetical protein
MQAKPGGYDARSLEGFRCEPTTPPAPPLKGVNGFHLSFAMDAECLRIATTNRDSIRAPSRRF